MDICPAVPAAAGFISSMTAYIDCQAQVLGSGAWTALSAPGSTLAVMLTGFLTIFIALIGYNLLLGQSVTVRSGTLAFVKIGAILALATSWPAYRTLIYDLITSAPSQLIAEIGPQAGVIGSDGTLTQRLDLTDQALAQLAILGEGNAPLNVAAQIPPTPFGGFNAFALGGSRILFEITALASLGIIRVIAGLLLALGPFFIAFLMFDSTRSLFEGWVRVLAGTGIAAIGVSIALGLELGLLEPWLSNVLARRMAGEALPTVATELFVITCLFSIIVAAALYGCARTTRAFRLAPLATAAFAAEPGRQRESEMSTSAMRSARAPEGQPSRAAAVANVLQAADRRELLHAAAVERAGLVPPSRGPSMGPTNEALRPGVPVGRTFTRRRYARTSTLARRRDGGA